MATMTARAMIRAEYGTAPNFVTDHPIRYGKLGPHAAYELAWGRRIIGDGIMYGVSVVLEHDGRTRRVTDLGGVAYSRDEADAMIAELRAQLRESAAFTAAWEGVGR